ncbi:hypothetical protein SAMN05216262_11120 [Colwellia chukchiensis]|uniref:N-acetyltransferase domain-containing protein n=1 Tax=Colwellia chukchiensis TaxID=641665 RepID=A0A1H7Q966_9GAMM|nr:GNAT family N-acetyltransferase [Colwellia chukchiensis]SEL44416.1 hypothetical protein SAMN05216262_11120 [Colwellia chukchiensis]
MFHNAQACQYEYHIDGHIAYIRYQEVNGHLHLTHTLVPEQLAGQGIAKALLEAVLAQLAKEHKKAVAKCSYIAHYQAKNPAKQALFAKPE